MFSYYNVYFYKFNFLVEVVGIEPTSECTIIQVFTTIVNVLVSVQQLPLTEFVVPISVLFRILSTEKQTKYIVRFGQRNIKTRTISMFLTTHYVSSQYSQLYSLSFIFCSIFLQKIPQKTVLNLYYQIHPSKPVTPKF